MDNWKNLLEVPTKDNSDSTKWVVRDVEKVVTCAVHSLGGISVLHGDFVPDDEPCGSDEISKVPLF